MGRLGKSDSGKANPKLCPICNHQSRAEIEQAVFSISPSNPNLTLDAIADAYDISTTDLRVHALMHSPLALDFSEESEANLVAGFSQRANHDTSRGDDTCATPNDLCIQNSQSPTDDASDSSLTSPPNPPATPQSATPQSATKRERLTDKVNMRESDMLLAAANEYLTTLTTLGRRIKRRATENSDESDQILAAFLTTPMVNLYIGSGAELRKAVQGISELNTQLNGPKDSSAEGLKALAAALSFSANAANLLANAPDSDSATQNTPNLPKGARFLDEDTMNRQEAIEYDD